MPTFQYVAVDEQGERIKRKVDARDESALRKELLRRNYEVKSIKSKKAKARPFERHKVKASEIMHFSRQMSAFMRSGISITDGLDVIAKATKNRYFGEVLYGMREQIRQGTPFADALARHAGIFPPYYIGILRSAELTGHLDRALDELAGYISRDLEAKRKVKSATVYPAIVLLMSIVTVAILTVWVLPKFAVFFKDLDAKLPVTTRLMITVSDTSRQLWFVYVLLLVLLAGVVYVFKSTTGGRRLRDRILLKIPVVGDIVLYSVVERVCRVLSAMTQGGVPMPDAMTAAVAGANNAVFEEGLQPARERMLEGEGLAGPIEASQLFPDAAVQMIRVGETTGTIGQQLDNAAEYYSRELDERLDRLTALFEPAVIIVMGVVVGFVAIALVQAMYGIYNSSSLTGGVHP
ncbi:MAG TPA: type II secretion system F family protein [Acidimicrobiia bacterium]|nr:type II secretion system F family protein [Acidimicrobiia bacterium]